MANNSAQGIRWNLGDLFESHDDPRIETTLNTCRTRAEDFANRFRAALEHSADLTAQTLLAGLMELEDISDALGRVGPVGHERFEERVCVQGRRELRLPSPP